MEPRYSVEFVGLEEPLRQVIAQRVAALEDELTRTLLTGLTGLSVSRTDDRCPRHCAQLGAVRTDIA